MARMQSMFGLRNGSGTSRFVDKEQLVCAYIDGTIEPPSDLRKLVETYRTYSTARANVVSWPRSDDERHDRIFDALVVLS